MPLSKELKQKWLDALKSGEYVQGQGNYTGQRNGVMTHCCIAVLGSVINNSKDSMLHKESPWNLLEGITINSERAIHRLIGMNDSNVPKDYKFDYSNVIPIIENLETID